MPSSVNKPEAIPKVGDRHSQMLIWRFNKEMYRFVGSVCKKCGKKQFPRRWFCAFCGSKELEESQLSHTGKILFSEFGIYGMARGYEDRQPQLFATVQLDDGPLLDGEIVNVPPHLLRQELASSDSWEFWDSIKDKRVRMVFRRMRRIDNGNLTYGYKFVIEDPPWRSAEQIK